MENRISRRHFLEKTCIGAGILLTYTISGNSLFADSTSNVSFSVDKGRGGCNKCEKAISDILNDKTKKMELEKIFAGKGKVTFYVRHQKRRKLPSGINIAVGHCTRDIKRQTSCFIDKCGKTITSESLLSTLKKQFKAKKS
jgi:hypothetical protein